MLSSSYSWICLTVFLSLLASSTPQFNSFSSRSRFQPTLSPRFGLNSFGRQRGLNSFGRGVFTTTPVDLPVTQTISISTLEPGIEKAASSTSPSTRRSSTTVAPVTPSSSVFGPQSLSSTEPAVAPRTSEPTRTTKTSSRGSSIFSGLGNIFSNARTKTTIIPNKSSTTTTEAVTTAEAVTTETVTTTVTTTRTTGTISTTSPTSLSKASLTTSERVATPGVFTNLFGRVNILTTKEPVDITTVDATTTEAAPSPSTPAKFSNLFGRSQSSSDHLVPQTTTKPTVQPLKLVTPIEVGGIDSSSNKPVFVSTTIGSTRRPTTTVGPVPASRSVFGELRRISTEAPVTPTSTESSVTAKTRNSGSSIFRRLAMATTTETVTNTEATTRSTITRTLSTTSPSKASITTSESVTTSGVLTNLLGRFNIFTRTTMEPEDLTTTATAPPLSPTGKVSNLFGRPPQSTAVTQPTITTTTQASREVGTGRRRGEEKDAALSESNKSEGILPTIEPSEEMMDKVVDFMESLIFTGSVPASNKQPMKGSSSSSSASRPDDEEVPLVQGKFSIFGTRREKNTNEGDSVTTEKIYGEVDVVADEEKVETFAGGDKVERVGEVKVSRKIGNLLARLNLTGRKQVKVMGNTSETKSDDKLDEEKPAGETSDEIMDIVLESMEKLSQNRNKAELLDSRPRASIPTRPSSPLGLTTSSSDPNSPRKPSRSFFSRNALKTRLRPLVAAALSSPQSSTTLEDKVSMLRAVLSEQLPPHIRDHILSRQFTQHARTLFTHQQILSVPAVEVTQAVATSQTTRARTTTNQETITSTQAITTVTTTTTEATTGTEAISTTKTTVISQAASRLKPTNVPTRRVLTVPVQTSKQSLNEKFDEVVSPLRRIKLFPPTTLVTPVDSPQSSVRVTAATKPGSGESSSENSGEPLPRRIVFLEAESDVQPAMKDNRKTTTQPSVNRRTTTQPSVNRRTTTQPSVNRRTTTQPSVNRRTTTQPSVNRRTTTQPSVNRRTTTQPSVNRRTTTKPSANRRTNTQPSVNGLSSSKQKAVKLLQQLVTPTKQPSTTSVKPMTTNLPTRRVVQTDSRKLFTTPTKETVTTPAAEMTSSVNDPFSTSNDEEATLPPQLESQSRRIVLLKSLASQILPELATVPNTISTTSVLPTSTTVSTPTVLPTVSSTSESRSRPVESLPRRIVLLKALSDLVKSDLSSPVSNSDLERLVSNKPTEKNSNKSPGLNGVDALPKLVSLANAQSAESSSTILGQITSSFSKVTEETPRTPVVHVSPTVSDTNQRTGKSLSRRIVLLKALSEDPITSEGSEHIIQKELVALHKPASFSETVSSLKSIVEDELSTTTPRRPIKPTPPLLPNLTPKAFKIHPAVPNASTLSVATTRQATLSSQKPSHPTTTSEPTPTLVTSKPTIRRVLVSEIIRPTRLPVVKTTIPLRSSPTTVPISHPVKQFTPTVGVKSTVDPSQSLTTRSPPIQFLTTRSPPTQSLTTRSPPTQSLTTRSPPTQSLTTRSPTTQSLTTRLLAKVATPIISPTRRLPRVESTRHQVLKTASESSSPAKDVIEIEVDVGGVETKAKASSPIVGKTFFSRTPYREVASFHSLGEGGVELVTVGGRTLARSSSGGRIPVRDSLPAGLTRTLKVTPVFITGVGRRRFF